MDLKFIVSIVIGIIIPVFVHSDESFYELLNVPQDASTREIRKAFKKLAITLHPDKNQNDPNAHEKFLRINRAYEVLKDVDLRKVYDLHGEAGLDPSSSGSNYQSWKYYNENFGIYDDDPEIITLSTADFESSVEKSTDVWFINYYSPMCSHCHDLAPTWRKVAKELLGVIRIGAVNCEDDWGLCSRQNIHSYPSLMLYPKRIKFDGMRDRGNLVNFVLKNSNPSIVVLDQDVFERYTSSNHFVSKPVLLIACQHEYDCPDFNLQAKVSLALDGLLIVMFINCEHSFIVCSQLKLEDPGIIYYPPGHFSKFSGTYLEEDDALSISKKILNFLPDIEMLDEENFLAMKSLQKVQSHLAWLVYFYLNEEDTEFKKLHSLLSNTRLRKVDCGADHIPSSGTQLCHSFNVHKFPTFVLFKPNSKFEMYYGRAGVHDVANFVKESLPALNFQTLTETELETLKLDNIYVIDFFTPWCPPCLKFLPELRKASINCKPQLQFGTVDCTQFPHICQSFDIDSYPSTVLFNYSVPHKTTGYHSASYILDFIEDIIHPSVIKIDSNIWTNEVMSTSKQHVWLVDFFAPWCWHCQEFSPELRKLAKMMKDFIDIKIGEIDCTVNQYLCRGQSVHSYPTIRLYPMDSDGDGAQYYEYDGHRSARSLQMWILDFLQTSVKTLTPYNFENNVDKSEKPWIIDFYSPGCGYCVEYAPKFQLIAKKLEQKARFGKVNCQDYPNFCAIHNIRSYPSVMFFWHKLSGSPIKLTNRDMDGVLRFTYSKLDEVERRRYSDEL